MYHNPPFTLLTSDNNNVYHCWCCSKEFTAFRYELNFRFRVIIYVRCATISDTLEHESHQHPLYYSSKYDYYSRCGGNNSLFRYDECDYGLDAKCALLLKKVMTNRYDDHPLFLSFGDMNVDSEYWCKACETKVSPKEWFYTCNNSGITLHILCVVGDFSYCKPGSHSISMNTCGIQHFYL